LYFFMVVAFHPAAIFAELSLARTFTVCSDIFLGQKIDYINLAFFENKCPIYDTTTGDTNSDF